MFERKTLLLVIAIALTAASAQTSPQHSGSPPMPVLSFGFGPAANMIPSIKNAPFSGVLTSQMERTLDDGTHINRENQEIVMRDSQGRIYRARTIRRTGANPSDIQLITLLVPSQHVQYLCTPLKVCRTIRYRDPSGLRHPPGFGSRKDPNLTTEDLGTSNISGMDVEGKRVTRTVPEGTIGNDRPIIIVDENWHSKELDIDIQVRRTDPRMGTHTVSMTDIVAGEPDAKYFELPEGYRIEPIGAMPTQPRPLEPFAPGGTEPGRQEQ